MMMTHEASLITGAHMIRPHRIPSARSGPSVSSRGSKRCSSRSREVAAADRCSISVVVKGRAERGSSWPPSGYHIHKDLTRFLSARRSQTQYSSTADHATPPAHLVRALSCQSRQQVNQPSSLSVKGKYDTQLTYVHPSFT